MSGWRQWPRTDRKSKSTDLKPALFVLLAGLFAVTVGGVAWLGVRAMDRWRTSSALLVHRTMDDVLTLLTTAVMRDMRGAEASVLRPLTYEHVTVDSQYEVAYRCASAFARFPYLESLFLWRGTHQPSGALYLFTRVDRPPVWALEPRLPSTFPVVTLYDPAPLKATISAVFAKSYRPRFVAFETTIDRSRYQVFARLLYDASSSPDRADAIGFMVDLDWVEDHYFADLIEQVARIGNGADALSLEILDGTGRRVAMTRESTPDAPKLERTFPLLFFDPSLVDSEQRSDTPVRIWRARVAVANETALLTGTTIAQRTFSLLCAAGLLLVVALGLTGRAIYRTAALARMRADFISTLTHELKTPLAGISLASETLARGRYTDPDVVPRYAAMLEQEGARLIHLVENLLTFARMTDPSRAMHRGLVQLDDLVEDAVEPFHPQLIERKIRLRVDVPHDLPAVRADRAAMLRVLENLIDNAAKYAGDSASISIIGRSANSNLHVWVSDQGPGIPPEDLPHVFEKFYRGSNARRCGSGLGLAIVEQVIRNHDGRVEIKSAPGVGTQVHITLPAI